MEDILATLDELDTKAPSKKSAPIQEVDLSRVDYKNLKKVIQTTNLYAMKNVSDKDLSCDWDLTLMPVGMQEEFDKYLSDRYNMYQIKEANLDFRIVVLYREGRSINFLHQFMTEKKVPVLESVREGRETKIKSQFVLPAGATAIVTETQYKSLVRYEKKRVTVKDENSDWFGVLVFKQLNEENLKKVNHSFVTLQDIKNNEFETQPVELGSVKKSVTMEYSNELDEL